MNGEVWVLILGLAWGNPNSRVQHVGEVLKIERVEVVMADRRECERAAEAWMAGNSRAPAGDTGFTRTFATCAGRRAP